MLKQPMTRERPGANVDSFVTPWSLGVCHVSSPDSDGREGATLLEVLVAIFVMGIGLLALLTLFPLGVLKMAEAIQNDRCAQCFRNANNTATLQGVRTDPLIFFDV